MVIFLVTYGFLRFVTFASRRMAGIRDLSRQGNHLISAKIEPNLQSKVATSSVTLFHHSIISLILTSDTAALYLGSVSPILIHF